MGGSVWKRAGSSMWRLWVAGIILGLTLLGACFNLSAALAAEVGETTSLGGDQVTPIGGPSDERRRMGLRRRGGDKRVGPDRD